MDGLGRSTSISNIGVFAVATGTFLAGPSGIFYSIRKRPAGNLLSLLRDTSSMSNRCGGARHVLAHPETSSFHRFGSGDAQKRPDPLRAASSFSNYAYRNQLSTEFLRSAALIGRHAAPTARAGRFFRGCVLRLAPVAAHLGCSPRVSIPVPYSNEVTSRGDYARLPLTSDFSDLRSRSCAAPQRERENSKRCELI
jgi:hypothetical protein